MTAASTSSDSSSTSSAESTAAASTSTAASSSVSNEEHYAEVSNYLTTYNTLTLVESIGDSKVTHDTNADASRTAAAIANIGSEEKTGISLYA